MSETEVLASKLEMVIAHQQDQNKKLDKLTDAMTRLATHEERLSSHYQGMQRLGGRMDRLEVRQTDLEKQVGGMPNCHTDDANDEKQGPTWLEKIVIGGLSVGFGAGLLTIASSFVG